MGTLESDANRIELELICKKLNELIAHDAVSNSCSYSIDGDVIWALMNTFRMSYSEAMATAMLWKKNGAI